MKRRMRTPITIALVLVFFGTACVADDDEASPTASSAEFVASREAAMRVVGTPEFSDALRSPGFGSIPNAELDRLVALIQREKPIPGVSKGDANTTYDVILQPGHYKRPPGKVGTAGAKVSERAFAAHLTAMVAEKIQKKSYKVLVVSADDYLKDNPTTSKYEGLTGKVFLAIHADGSESPCSSGPSLGYKANSSMTGMHQLALAVAIALGYTFDEYQKDNFTANLSQYYMLSKVRTGLMAGILEVGELTCKIDEEKMIGSADIVAANIATALDFILSRGR